MRDYITTNEQMHVTFRNFGWGIDTPNFEGPIPPHSPPWIKARVHEATVAPLASYLVFFLHLNPDPDYH